MENFFPAAEGPMFVGYDSTHGDWRIESPDSSSARSIELPSMIVRGEGGQLRLISTLTKGADGRAIAGVRVVAPALPWLGLRDSSYGPRGVYAWLLGGPPRLTFFPFDSGDGMTVVDGTEWSTLGSSLSPNGRKLLYSRTVTRGADLMLLDNFK